MPVVPRRKTHYCWVWNLHQAMNSASSSFRPNWSKKKSLEGIGVRRPSKHFKHKGSAVWPVLGKGTLGFVCRVRTRWLESECIWKCESRPLPAYACMYWHMCMCTYTDILYYITYIHMYVHIHYDRMCVCIHILYIYYSYIYIHMYVYVCICIYICICMYIAFQTHRHVLKRHFCFPSLCDHDSNIQ